MLSPLCLQYSKYCSTEVVLLFTISFGIGVVLPILKIIRWGLTRAPIEPIMLFRLVSRLHPRGLTGYLDAAGLILFLP